MIYIVYGVSGVGKTTVGKALAASLSLPFYDADDFHSLENITKMNAGIPLTDDDRLPWLRLLAEEINSWSKSGGAVLACSALKQGYRNLLSSHKECRERFILLQASISVVKERFAKRENHFMHPNLLKSQYESLETGATDLVVDANKAIELIIQDIMENIKAPTLGLIGLGVMGQSIARNIANNGFNISVYNRQTETEVDVAKEFVTKYPKLEMKGFDRMKPFIDSLSKPRNILLMVNAGEVVDLVIKDLLPLLDEKDLIIDGGNSHFSDSKRRQAELLEHNIYFLGMGVSGGEEGALKGPSIMPSGEEEAYARIAPILNKIAAKDKHDSPCCAYLGPGGAGHFVKMIHNGIEYGEMQLIAEVYHFLRHYQELSPEKIANLFYNWSQSGLESYLLQITIDILRTKEKSEYLIDLILDKAEQKGTGGWSTNAALALGKPLDTISQAVMVRCLSAMKDTRIKASDLYKDVENNCAPVNLDKLKQAYQACRIINHAIGFDVINSASIEYGWQLNLAELARIWTNGCIIRSELMEGLIELNKEKEHLLLHPSIVSQLQRWKPAMQETISKMMLASCPASVMSAAVNYFYGFVSGQSSANIVQAQRDYFGAHTVQRTDASSDQYFHFNWKK